MATPIDAGTIRPGLPVYGIDGSPLGTIESVSGDAIRVLGHTVPASAIARVAPAGVHLCLARTAFLARLDRDLPPPGTDFADAPLSH